MLHTLGRMGVRQSLGPVSSAGAPAPFAPSDLSNLQLWLDSTELH